MTTLPELVQNEIDERCHVTGKLNKNGCEVKMTNAPAEKLVIDLDKPGSPIPANEVRCDYLMIALDGNAKGLVVAFELKRGLLRVEKTVEQLRAGAANADQLVTDNPAIEIRFRPVAVSGRTNKHTMRDLKKEGNKIAFRGKPYALRRISCGGCPAATFYK